MFSTWADARELRRLSDASRLVVVAHPDDETFWAGLTLAGNGGWAVVCLTHRSNPSRRKRFRAAVAALGCRGALLDLPDRHWDALSSAEHHQMELMIDRILDRPGITDVMTHSPDGETGHPYHKLINSLVASRVPSGVTLHYFNFDSHFDGPRDDGALWARKQAALDAYFGVPNDPPGNDGLHIRLSRHERAALASDYRRQAALIRSIYAGSTVPNADIADAD